MLNIMDMFFNGAGRSEMYRAQVFPELFKHQPAMRLENWSWDELVAFCGGDYAKTEYTKEVA